MPASIQEVTASRTGSSTTATRKYRILDAADESDVFAQIATIPNLLAGLPFSDFTYDEVEGTNNSDDSLSDYDVTIQWGQPDRSVPQAAGTSEFRFNFQAPSAHIYQSLETISTYSDAAIWPYGAPPFHGAINVVQDDGKQRVEGFNLQPPAEVFSIPYTDVGDVITPAYLNLVKGLCGKVSSSSFEGGAAGEIMLVRAQGGRKGGLWNLDFGFAHVANAIGIPVGDNMSVTKDGMDLLWTLYGTFKDDTTKSLNRQPSAAYVERVFYRADLNTLNLP